MRYIKLYMQFFLLQLKAITEYRADFLIGTFSVMIGQLNVFLLTLVIFTQMKSIGGFIVQEFFLMYGFYILVKGIDHFYNDNIWSLAWNMIKDGRFALCLLRPINPIFYIIMERVEITGVCESIIGVVIVLSSYNNLNLHLEMVEIVGLLIIMICGLIVFFSIKLLFSTPAFWTTCCGEFMTAGVEISNSAKYPLSVYRNKVVKNILLFIFPFAISGYFPTIFCLKKESVVFGILGRGIYGYEVVVYSIVVSGLLLAIALLCWHRGLRRYEPSGT